MIALELLDKPYEEITIRSKVSYICDYCGGIFQRDKKSRERMNKYLPKDSCGSKACSSKKRCETNQSKYGVDYAAQLPETIEKIQKTCMEKYGNKSYSNTEEFFIKSKETSRKRYGVDFIFQSKEIREKGKETMKILYGVDNFAKTQQHKNLLKEYAKNRTQEELNEQLRKREKTTEEKYGKKHYTQTEQYWADRRNKCLATHGVDHESKLKSNRDLARKTTKEKYGVDNYSKTEEFIERTTKTCIERIGVPFALCLPENRIYGKTQKEIQDWLNSFGLNFKTDYTVLNGKEIDMYDENRKIAIEYCGLYWHNESMNKNKTYHFDKYKKCKDSGVTLITIFEDEWKKNKEKCQFLLRSQFELEIENSNLSEKINFEFSNKENFNLSCKKYHLLGESHSGEIFLFVKINQETIGGISFFTDYNENKICCVIDRIFFTNSSNNFQAEAIKQFLSFIKIQDFNYVEYYTDNRWYEDKILQKSGFNLKKEFEPEYKYVKYKYPISRINYQLDENISEEEWAKTNELAKIWDCGSKLWSIEL